MQLDFWNNPLVVTAMRLKYRRGSPGVWAALWVLALLGVGAFLHYMSQHHAFRFPTTYLAIILGLQAAVSAVIAVVCTSASMNAEVVNRTLDFQRIVTLSPRAILTGKMIGEPALSYFLMIASMPLAAICWGFGAASGAVVFWLYVNLTTFTLMWASFGLINSLTPPAQTTGRQKSGGGGAGFAIMFAVFPQLIFHGREALNTPGAGDVVQMLTPLGSLFHLWKDSAWNARVEFWGVSLPSLLVAPVVELSVAAWIVSAMSRRLKNALDPLASKRRSYVTLAVIDLVIAGICYSLWANGFDAAKLVYGYGLAHIIVCMIMMFATVPRRAALISWIWRRDPQQPLMRELLAASRSEMSLAGVVYGLIGVAVLMIGLVGPMSLSATPARSVLASADLAQISLTTFVIVVGLAMLHQMLVAAMSRGGHLWFILFVILANLLPPVIAAALQASTLQPAESFTETLTTLSPVALYSLNMSRVATPMTHAGWLIAAYAGLGLICYAMIRRVMRRESAIVHMKLQDMGLGHRR